MDYLDLIKERIEELKRDIASAKCPKKKFFLQSTLNANLKVLLALSPKGTCH